MERLLPPGGGVEEAEGGQLSASSLEARSKPQRRPGSDDSQLVFLALAQETGHPQRLGKALGRDMR